MGFGRSKGPQRITNSSEIALDGLLLGGRTLPLGVPVFLISVRRLPAPPQPPQQTKEHRVWPMAGPIQLTIRNLKTWLPFCLRRCPPQPCERDHRRKKLNLRKFSLHSTKKARLPTEEGESHGKTEKTRGEVVAAPVGAGEGQLGRECLGSRERLVNLEGSEGPLPPPSSPQLQPARGACCGLSEDVPGERRAFIPGVGLYPEPLGTGNGWSPHCTVRQKGSREEVWKEPPT